MKKNYLLLLLFVVSVNAQEQNCGPTLPPVPFDPNSSYYSRFGTIIIDSLSDPRYSFDFLGAPTRLHLGDNVLGNADGSQAILPAGDNTFFGGVGPESKGNPGEILDKNRRLVLTPRNEEAATITISYALSFDYNRAVVNNRIYLVAYFPKAVDATVTYFIYDFDNKLFLTNLKNLIKNALWDKVEQAGETGDRKQLYYLGMLNAIDKGNWNIKPYLLNIRLNPYAGSGGASSGGQSDPESLAHPLEIQSIDVPFWTYEYVGGQAMCMQDTVRIDRSQLENLKNVVDAYFDTLPPKDVPGKVSNGTSNGSTSSTTTQS